MNFLIAIESEGKVSLQTKEYHQAKTFARKFLQGLGQSTKEVDQVFTGMAQCGYEERVIVFSGRGTQLQFFAFGCAKDQLLRRLPECLDKAWALGGSINEVTSYQFA